MEIFVDRSRKEAIATIAGTWLLFCLSLFVEAEPPILSKDNMEDFTIGGVLGALVMVVGYSATSRCRLLPERSNTERAKFASLSLLAGIVVGAVILLLQLRLSTAAPGIQTQWARYLGEPVWRPLARAVGAAIIEEVVFRLFLMGVIAWAVVRFRNRAANAFPIALGVSALVFGLVHLTDFSLVGLTFVLSNAAGGLLLGWIFWRWGLPYAVLCHFAGGVVIQSFGPRLLA